MGYLVGVWHKGRCDVLCGRCGRCGRCALYDVTCIGSIDICVKYSINVKSVMCMLWYVCCGMCQNIKNKI